MLANGFRSGVVREQARSYEGNEGHEKRREPLPGARLFHSAA
ncbi:hypothetical protein PCLA_11r0236 [Pseudomonas citronellolis]|nr:hypothetical protein PCLA_11r0236 [Pseudomonas citronellolis]